jgi:hypothetical protein
MTRWDVVQENVQELRRQTDLLMLCKIIGDKFDGKVDMQKNIIEYMTEKFRWGNRRTMRNLDMLVELNLLKCIRDPRNRWTKTYYLLDA